MIEVQNIKKTYNNGTVALNNINIKVGKGEIVGVIGRNGAGKSTLFKIICGLITDYSGESKVFSHKSSIEFADRVSYLPEVRGLDTRMYVLEHIVDLLLYKGLNKKQAENNVIKWLKEFQLYNYRYNKISDLSKGNQQKLQLIVAIASEPEILILDEPFSGLDLITIDLFWDVITNLRDNGCTVLFSTHDLNDNLNKCNSFIFLNHGELHEKGTLQEIQDHFVMVLEIKNRSLSLKALENIVPATNVKEMQQEYYIRIKNENVAREIFESLDDKYCEKFYVRKLSLQEIFREVCR